MYKSGVLGSEALASPEAYETKALFPKSMVWMFLYKAIMRVIALLGYNTPLI